MNNIYDLTIGVWALWLVITSYGLVELTRLWNIARSISRFLQLQQKPLPRAKVYAIN